ncbi:WD40 repeat-like protein [Linderina pennispora]|uniref:WD40 repeat-like protein n=1 Tax=Linderina pennispora TaxID=61395 RepID=A0A1Y1WGY3_9FUNG|nr:WD40 repeat-like protein [Linderina pennispora]ORX72732.1 WD40 repeat-like protein [Linderina pennispora]
MSVYETESGTKRAELDGHLGDVTCCQFFPSGQVVLSGATDMRLKIWSASDGTNPVTLVGHRATVTDTEIVGVGKNVLSCSKDGTVRLWHCGSSSLIHTFELSKLPVNRIRLVSYPERDESKMPENEFETAGKVVAAACEDGRAVLLDLGTKKTISEFGATNGTPVRAVAYDIVQQLVYVGLSDGVVQVWSDSDTSKPMFEFKRNSSAITDVALVRKESGSLPLVCVSTEDGQLYLVAPVLSSGNVVGVEVVEELAGFDVDPINRVRVAMSTQKDATRQAVWAAGRVKDIFEF